MRPLTTMVVTFHVVGRGAITGFKRPRDPQAFDVLCIDLIESRIVCSVRIAVINGPVRTRSCGEGSAPVAEEWPER